MCVCVAGGISDVYGRGRCRGLSLQSPASTSSLTKRKASREEALSELPESLPQTRGAEATSAVVCRF